MAMTLTQVAASTASATLASLDNEREALYIYNGTAVTAYIRLGGGTASSADASFVLPAGSTWEAPSNVARQAVTGALASGTGNLTVTVKR